MYSEIFMHSWHSPRVYQDLCAFVMCSGLYLLINKRLRLLINVSSESRRAMFSLRGFGTMLPGCWPVQELSKGWQVHGAQYSSSPAVEAGRRNT